MTRVCITTTIDEILLKQAYMKAAECNYRGANKIIELALEFYFSKADEEIWEKELASGCIERVIIKPTKIITENIRNRLERTNFNSKDYSPENLKSKGWVKV
jgi:hypothetical protein